MQVARAAGWVVVSVAAAALGLNGACFGGGSGNGSGDASLADECVPYDDDCAAGTYCQYADGRTQCVPEGVIARDAPCIDRGCTHGSICLPGNQFDMPSSCQQPCDLDASTTYPCDITRHTCFPAVDDDGNELSFGVCRYVQ